MSSTVGKVIMCTGGNRGLGYSILQVAGKRNPASTFILTARKEADGEAAAEQLIKEGINAKIDVIELDVTDDAQVCSPLCVHD
jgi:NAD(P)-dependent dehydrogenase (short-subunit alcohol dehydrogenase family)